MIHIWGVSSRGWVYKHAVASKQDRKPKVAVIQVRKGLPTRIKENKREKLCAFRSRDKHISCLILSSSVPLQDSTYIAVKAPVVKQPQREKEEKIQYHFLRTNKPLKDFRLQKLLVLRGADKFQTCQAGDKCLSDQPDGGEGLLRGMVIHVYQL